MRRGGAGRSAAALEREGEEQRRGEGCAGHVERDVGDMRRDFSRKREAWKDKAGNYKKQIGNLPSYNSPRCASLSDQPWFASSFIMIFFSLLHPNGNRQRTRDNEGLPADHPI